MSSGSIMNKSLITAGAILVGLSASACASPESPATPTKTVTATPTPDPTPTVSASETEDNEERHTAAEWDLIVKWDEQHEDKLTREGRETLLEQANKACKAIDEDIDPYVLMDYLVKEEDFSSDEAVIVVAGGITVYCTEYAELIGLE